LALIFIKYAVHPIVETLQGNMESGKDHCEKKNNKKGSLHFG